MADDQQEQSEHPADPVDGELDQLLAEVDEITSDVQAGSGGPQNEPQADNPAAQPGGDQQPVEPVGEAPPDTDAPHDSTEDNSSDPQADVDQTLQETKALADQAVEQESGQPEEHTGEPEPIDSDQKKGEENQNEPGIELDDQPADHQQTGADKEVEIDESTEKIAEQEIEQAIDRIDKSKDGDSNRQGAGAGPTATIPGPLKLVLTSAVVLDSVFLWMPRSVKNCIGYLGISALLLGIILWILIMVG